MKIANYRYLMNGIVLLSMILIVTGCGYRIHGHSSLPFTEINIGQIENKTLQPKLQDKLQRVLTEEFLKQGIKVSPAAELKLSGTVHKFSMAGLSEKKGTTVEYTIDIVADFKLIDREGSVRETKNIKSPFIVSFTSSNELGMLLSNRDLAEEKALADIAAQLVGALIFK
jgi:outer membrane lipopolysaccharide assembly protein LptE/RlpB